MGRPVSGSSSRIVRVAGLIWPMRILSRGSWIAPWTMAAAQGASLRELMERMGHSSTRAVLIYLHATRERDEAIAAGMGKLLTNARKTDKQPNRSGTQRARGRNRAS